MRSMDGVKSREEIQQADRVWNIDKSLIQEKLDRVIEKLMNLGGPENREELAEGGEAIGFFKRDFGKNIA